MHNLSLSKDKIKILLLEGISPNAISVLKWNWYTKIELIKWALSEEDLIEKIKDVHIVGIRSKTKLTKKVLENAKKLLCIWCFCIWTNQVDLDMARWIWVPVFNAPFSNTRSVAELVISHIISLFRWIWEKNILAHKWIWKKSANHSYEIRGKNLWIIGYWHIWVQLSVLAENFWMNVCYYDIENQLWIWNAKKCESLNELLSSCDVVSLHVPETSETKNMIWAVQFKKMKKWSYIINAARWSVIQIDDLVDSLKQEHLFWAAIDVFPKEPKNNDEEFISALREFDNVILTPHIWWSTLEAQENIWTEVAEKLVKYTDNWSTLWSVNFAEISLPWQNNTNRVLNIHKNIPWMMKSINEIFSTNGINIAGQYLKTFEDVWYVITDTDAWSWDFDSLKNNLQSIDWSIKTRILY